MVGLQVAFHSHGTTSLLLIAYTKYLLSFGVHLSLNFIHMFTDRVSSHAESYGALCYHGTHFVLGKTCTGAGIVAQLAQNDTPALGEVF